MPTSLDVDLHVKYIQNLDEVRSLYSGWDGPASWPKLRWLSEKRPGVPFNRTSPCKRGILGFDCVMYNGPERCSTERWDGRLCHELLGWWSWWVLVSSTSPIYYLARTWKFSSLRSWYHWFGYHVRPLLTFRNIRGTSWSRRSYPRNALCHPDLSDSECSR